MTFTRTPAPLMIVARCLRALMLALLATLLGGVAQAADPVRGASLFATAPTLGQLACADCHSDEPSVNNFGNIFVGRNAVALIQRAIGANTGGMGYFSRYYGTTELADIAAYLGNTPATLVFASTPLGRSSAMLSVAVYASTKTDINNLSADVEGEFAIQQNRCATVLARGESCAVDVTFKPTTAGLRSGTLLIKHDGTPTPVRILLSGAGLERPPAVARVQPAQLGFAPVAAGNAGEQQTVTLFNDSTQVLTLGGTAVSSSDFVLSGGNCRAGAVLSSGQSCTLALRFDPVAEGSRNGSLRVEHDGVGGSSTVALQGTGLAGPAAALSIDASALAFGALPVGAGSPVQWLTLINTGAAALQWRDIAATHSAFIVDRSGCPQASALTPAQSCRVGVSFQPGRASVMNGELVVAALGLAQPYSVVLSGTGGPLVPLGATTTSTPASIQPPGWVDASAIVFHDEVRGNSDASDVQRVTLTHRGKAPLALGNVQIVGDHAADFSALEDCQAETVLQPASVCSVALRFSPQAAGLRQATLLLGHATISLQGRAWAVLPDIAAKRVGTPANTSTSLAWQATPLLTHTVTGVGDAPTAALLTLLNTGTASVESLRWAITGPAVHDFSLDPASSCHAGMSIAPTASCVARVLFHPTAPGLRSAHVVALAADGLAAEAALRGNASAPPIGIASVQPESVAFTTTPELRNGRQTVVVSNIGGGVLRVESISIQSPAFTLSASLQGACPTRAFDLMPGASCRVEVAWAGSAAASLGGTLLLTTDAAGPVAVPLLVTEDPGLRTNEGVGGGAIGLLWLVLLAWASSRLAASRTKSRHG